MTAVEQLPSCRLASAPGWPLVLYFHHVHPSLEHYTSLTPSAFALGLDLVLEHFEPVSLAAVLDGSGELRRPERPSVLVTFDDGYADLTEGALPALAARDVPATFFVCTDLLDGRSSDPRADYLSWADCAGLAAAGHTVAAHGRTHRPLPDLSPAERAQEVTGSLSALRDRLGVGLPVYAYPYGLVAEIPERVAGFAAEVTAFGSVKAQPRPWPEGRHDIRRTYLPTGAEDSWPELVAHWRAAWDRS